MDQTLPEQIYTGTKQKLLELLGSGVGPQAAADAVGVDCSYVTQLLSESHFAQAVTQLRFDRLQKASDLDRAYEDLEMDLVEKLRNILPFMCRTGEILAAIRIINATKRRGSGIAPTSAANVTIVQLILPTKLVQRFKVNEQNQVIQVGEQILVTMDSKTLLKQVEEEKIIKDFKGELNERTPQQTYLPARQSA